MTPAEETLQRAVFRAGLPAEARILVAVSGGPDSVALLDTLQRCASLPQQRWSLLIGHVNHGLRGEESEQDERFVRTMAKERGLDVEVARVDTAAHARKRRLSMETAARVLRYQALRSMLSAWPGDLITTGHTLDDQAETIILRLMRGTGITGLGGMRARSGEVVRPFLGVRRETVLQAIQDRGLGYRLDSSNLDPRFARNRVRREVIPTLRAVQPRAIEVLGRTGQLLQLDSDFIEMETDLTVKLLEPARGDDEISASLGVWQALHPALQRHTLRRLITDLLGDSRDLDESHLAIMVTSLQRGDPVSGRLPRGLTVYVGPDRFTLRVGSQPPPSGPSVTYLDVPGSAQLEGGGMTASVLEMSDREEIDRQVVVCGPLHAFCDAHALGTHLMVRSRLPGDRIRLLGGGTRKLQDVFTDKHVPADARDRVPVVINDQHIVWVPGLVLDRRVAVTRETTGIVHLRFQPNQS